MNDGTVRNWFRKLREYGFLYLLSNIILYMCVLRPTTCPDNSFRNWIWCLKTGQLAPAGLPVTLQCFLCIRQKPSKVRSKSIQHCMHLTGNREMATQPALTFLDLTVINGFVFHIFQCKLHPIAAEIYRSSRTDCGTTFRR